MSFDALRFLLEYGIDHTEIKKGWVQVHCPFCSGSRDYHLGINLSGDYGSCWRCKGKSIPAIVQALTQCSWSEAYRITKQYGGNSLRKSSKSVFKATGYNPKIEVHLPEGCGPLNERHKRYLEKRGFDPEELEELYDLKGSGPVGQYKHRIVAPIVWDGNLVSYQGRDITGKAVKYMACSLDKEALCHKNTLYGIDDAKKESVIVVEGIVDQWRLGFNSVATFGTSFTPSQVLMLKNRFQRVFLLFDPEKQAQRNAIIMGQQLAAVGLEVERLLLDSGDPGDMKQDDADHLMKELGLWQ